MGALFPAAEILPFPSFMNRFAGQSAYVIGRGETSFDYDQLSDVNDPVFFINDAVSLEAKSRGSTFFFAHDRQLLPWLNRDLKSIAVLPRNGRMFTQTLQGLPFSGRVVFYNWTEKDRALLTAARDYIAQKQKLFTHSGTIHSAIHFAWFCGIERVRFIGCQGIGGHDPRLANRSNSTLDSDYSGIRQAQDMLVQVLGLHAEYLDAKE